MGATLLEALLGRSVCRQVWMRAYSGYNQQSRAHLRSAMQDARTAARSHASLLYDDVEAAGAEPCAAAQPAAMPVALGRASSHARDESKSMNSTMSIAEQTAMDPDGRATAAHECARRRALARELTALVFRCLEMSPSLRVSSDALAEGAAACVATVGTGTYGSEARADEAWAPPRRTVSMPRLANLPPLETQGTMPPLDRQAFADHIDWAGDTPPQPFTISPEASGYERLAEHGQIRTPIASFRNRSSSM